MATDRSSLLVIIISVIFCIAVHHHAVVVVLVDAAARGAGTSLPSPPKSSDQVKISKDYEAPSNSSAIYSDNIISLINGSGFNRVTHMAWTSSRRSSYYGVKARLSVHQLPDVEAMQTSSAVIQLVNDDDQSDDGKPDVIEAGWHVNTELYNDAQTHLYISWRTRDESCYNNLCVNGFVLTKRNAAFPGMVLEAPAAGAPQYITLSILRAQSGDWYLSYQDNMVTTNIGYWPGSLFRGLAKKATQVRLGGMISTPANPYRYPPMGSGRHGADREGAAACFRDIQLMDQYGNRYGYDHFDVVADVPRCYDVMVVPPHSNVDLAHFYYGGPSGCKV